MSQNQKPNQRPKRKIEAKPEHVIIENVSQKLAAILGSEDVHDTANYISG